MDHFCEYHIYESLGYCCKNFIIKVIINNNYILLEDIVKNFTITDKSTISIIIQSLFRLNRYPSVFYCIEKYKIYYNSSDYNDYKIYDSVNLDRVINYIFSLDFIYAEYIKYAEYNIIYIIQKVPRLTFQYIFHIRNKLNSFPTIRIFNKLLKSHKIINIYITLDMLLSSNVLFNHKTYNILIDLLSLGIIETNQFNTLVDRFI